MLWLLGYDKSAELLIRKGADVNVVNNLGQTALMKAAEKGNKRVAYILNEVHL